MNFTVPYLGELFGPSDSAAATDMDSPFVQSKT